MLLAETLESPPEAAALGLGRVVGRLGKPLLEHRPCGLDGVIREAGIRDLTQHGLLYERGREKWFGPSGGSRDQQEIDEQLDAVEVARRVIG